MSRSQIELFVKSATYVAHDIRIFELCHPLGADLPAFEAGAHLSFQLSERMLRQYSVASDPVDRSRYVIAVKRQENSRGGSVAMHALSTGDTVVVHEPQNSFHLQDFDGEHLLISGGIGITPLISMAHTLRGQGRSFTLKHFASRRSHAGVFDRLIGGQWSAAVDRYSSEHGEPTVEALGRLAAATVVSTAVYICGPSGFISSAVRLFEPVVGRNNIHFEHFEPLGVGAGGEFLVDVIGRASNVRVSEGQSILQALRGRGVDVTTSCEMGVCGVCLAEVVEGAPDHRDDFLSEEEKTAGKWILPCVSRCSSLKITLKLLG